MNRIREQDWMRWFEGMDGVEIFVRVIPRASKTRVGAAEGGRLRIRLTAPPVDGAANKHLAKFLSRVLHIPKSNVSIIAGEKSRDKTVVVRGCTQEQVRALLEGARDGR